METVSGARTFAAASRTRRRRFLLASIAALTVVGVALGVSFTADTGVASPSVTAGSTSALVFPVKANGRLPLAIDSLKHTTGASKITVNDNGTPSDASDDFSQLDATPDLPTWSPVAGAAGTISSTGAGDLFVIDGRSASAGGAAKVIINIYITNLAAIQPNYSSYAWPIRVYQANGASVLTSGAWTPVSIVNGFAFNAADFYLTNTGGFLSYSLPTDSNRYYLITMDDGGSFYCVGTDQTAPESLTPEFYATAQAT